MTKAAAETTAPMSDLGLLVIDASVVIAECLPERHSARAREILVRVAREGGVVPGLWAIEVGSSLLAAERRGRLRSAERRWLLDRFGRLPITIDAETWARAWIESMRLAEEHRLTLYDSTYLELAVRLSLPLATFDVDLQRAAREAGVVLV